MFQYWQSNENAQWYFHLRSNNRKIVLMSEGYLTEAGCLKGIDSIVRLVRNPEVTIKKTKKK
jgi:uncharacterized protein YegP (UPF0339 family)